MENIKKNLLKWFTNEELKTIKKNESICPYCKNKCGSFVKLEECKNKIIMCFNCLDMFNDSCNEAYLFNCPCCDEKINDYIVIEN